MTAPNQYHILSFIPSVEAWEMPPALEALAQHLVTSGRLRINADTQRNFVRHDAQSFSARELTDPLLSAAVRADLARYVAPVEGEEGVARLWQLLRSELKKTRGISPEKELHVARVLVQAAHPSVIALLLKERTEIFVSYSHDVSDLMALERWQEEGRNSGLQATLDTGAAIYISCGGDPFFEGEHKTYVTDGFPALARMVIIAAQELGHFADLRRERGRIVGRTSVDPVHRHLRAAPHVAHARLSDQQRVVQLGAVFRSAGLEPLRRAESAVAFYAKRMKGSPPWLWHQLRRLAMWVMFLMRCVPSPVGGGLGWGRYLSRSRPTKPTSYLPPYGGRKLSLRTHPRLMQGHAITAFLDDMAFNLAPDAEVYRRADPLEEEAIACIEALARVPQQVCKWGADAVAAAWPGLYAVYYGEVIQGCIRASGVTSMDRNIGFLHRLRIAFKRRWRGKVPYYY